MNSQLSLPLHQPLYSVTVLKITPVGDKNKHCLLALTFKS